MKHRSVFGFLIFLFATTLVGAAPADRFEPAIAAFEEADRETPPPQDAILFIGSSSIRGWRTLAEDLPDYDVINRGFGGAWVSDCTYFFDRVVVPYSPEVIVFYAGENDITGGTDPEVVSANFKRFVEQTREKVGDAHIAFISMKPSPSRWHVAEAKRKGNALIQSFTDANEDLSYIDVFEPMLGEDGKPREELFVGDELHMNETGYALWTEIVGGHLQQIGAPKKSDD